MFLSSNEARETPTLLGSLEKANLNHWSSEVSAPSPEKRNRSSFRNVVFSSFWNVHKPNDSDYSIQLFTYICILEYYFVIKPSYLVQTE
jgi:hypothetical protein